MSSRFLVFVAAIALSLAAAAPFRRTEPYVAPKKLADLVKIAEEGGDVKRGAAALKPKYEDVDELEKAYKRRNKGGVGVGRDAKAGVEMKLAQWDRLAMSPEELRTQKKDVLHVAYHVIAITEITKLFGSEKPYSRDVGIKTWNESADSTLKAAKQLASAAKADDPKAVQKAAKEVINGCWGCHGRPHR